MIYGQLSLKKYVGLRELGQGTGDREVSNGQVHFTSVSHPTEGRRLRTVCTAAENTAWS